MSRFLRLVADVNKSTDQNALASVTGSPKRSIWLVKELSDEVLAWLSDHSTKVALLHIMNTVYMAADIKKKPVVCWL